MSSPLENRFGVRGALVRPDGVISWIDADGEPGPDTFAEAATSWFGLPRS